MRNSRFLLLALCIILFFLMLTSSCGKPSLPEQSSLETVETTAPPPLSDTETKPSDTTVNTYESTGPNLPYTEYDQTVIISRQKELLKLKNNKTPYNDLITKTVDIYEFVRTFSPVSVVPAFLPSLAAIDEEIGVECLRRNKAGNYYSVHKLKQGGLLYIFYIDELGSRNYLRMLNWFVVQKSLSYEDFSAISKGSSLEDVKVIDPVTEIYEQRGYSYLPRYNKDNSPFYSQHYLTDGILTIHYTYTDAKWTVKYDEYRNNFQIDYIYNSGSPKYNGRILDIDAIQ